MLRMKDIFVKIFVWSVLCFALPVLGGCGGGYKEATGTASPASGDIVAPGDGIKLSGGWYAVEHYGGTTFRWVRNNAEFSACPDASHHAVVINVEPGPSMGSHPLKLFVRDRYKTSAYDISARDQIVFALPESRMGPVPIVLQARGGNIPVPKDPRTLNFRVFKISIGSRVANCNVDITDAISPLETGANWFPLESFGGSTFRWMTQDGQLRLTRAEPRGSNLSIEVEKGPGFGNAPGLFTVVGPHGVVATSPQFGERTMVNIHLPAAAAGTVYTIHVRSAGKLIQRDPRVLNLRVFFVKLQ